jgi:hypothetical protein
MGAGASACQSETMFSQLMAKWDVLMQQPQFSVDIKKPGSLVEET